MIVRNVVTALILLAAGGPAPAATPPLLSAGNKSERCAAIQEWMDSITVLSRGGAANARTEQIMQYAAPGFRSAIGKSYAALSKSERKQVARALRDCTKEAWVDVVLTRAFELNPEYPEGKSWAAAFARGERSPAATRLVDRQASSDLFARRSAVAALVEKAKQRDEAEAKAEKEMHRLVMKASDAAMDARKKHRNAESDLIWREKGVYELARASVRRQREFHQRLIGMARMGLPSAAELFNLGTTNTMQMLRWDREAEAARMASRREFAIALKNGASEPARSLWEKELAAYATVQSAIDRERQTYDEYQRAIGAASVLETAQRMELEAQRQRELQARIAMRRQRAGDNLLGLVVAGGAVIAVAIVLRDVLSSPEERQLASEIKERSSQPAFEPLKFLCEMQGGTYSQGACLGARRD